MQKIKLFFIASFLIVDINTAPLTQLDNLVGIGPALGQRIIDNRPYTSIDDLLKVQGIGPKNLEKIKQQGLATTSGVRHMSDTSLTPEHYPSNIFLSEVLPSPEGADTENEFVELFNANNFAVDISEFKIRDKIGTIKTFSVPTGTKIPANGFLVFKSSQTKISLNNTGDGVDILDPSGKTIDSVDFGKSQPGQSWSKIENTWFWTAKPTPDQANVILAIQTASSSSTQATSSAKNNLTANIQNYSPQRKNFLAVGIATAIAFSSALIAWRIKKNSHEV